jgi:hypothetical protein
MYSLINIAKDFDLKFKEGDIIEFEVPFYDEDYQAIVKKDKNFGFYINNNHFDDCKNFLIRRNGKQI